MKGFGGVSVMEIVAPFHGDTWRTVYTVRLKDVVYVLHAFQKKSKLGIATPKKEIDLIQRRLATAEREHGKGKLEMKKRRKIAKEEAITVGSGNVFADLGIPTGQVNKGQQYDQKKNSIWLMDDTGVPHTLESSPGQGRAPDYLVAKR